MSAMLDHLVTQLFSLHVRLMACRERLAANTDSEALHDLRTSTRRLRSLIRPVREVPAIAQLEDAARALGRLTTPLRDREVLAAHLLEQGHSLAGQPSLAEQEHTFAKVADSAELARLLTVLDAAPALLRVARRDKLLPKPGEQVEKRLRKQWRKLREALEDPAHDRHRLRLLIKRVRYGDEAFPQLDHAGKKLRALLKRAQSDLGDWHDRLQWLLQAEREQALAPFAERWQRELHRFEGKADATLEQLGVALARRRH
ncbi:CHAD domain-containing protein [Pseudomonas sp. UBA6562]|uniref:CHAD domain-containing protein n=1 Tax=Pseudomonas sp. UBA6562 TaxID=1947332 RepID=UPI0025D12682|nr:CHAD domain-containing protein [Pseudomonas sp. UBA6562]